MGPIFRYANSPRIGLNYKPKKDGSLWISYGESFRSEGNVSGVAVGDLNPYPFSRITSISMPIL